MNEPAASPPRVVSRRDVMMIAGGALLALLSIAFWSIFRSPQETESPAAPETPAAVATSGDAFTVPPEVLKVANVEMATVTRRPRIERITAPAVVQPNELEIQDITPLVSGRVERVFVVEGSAVTADAVLLTMSSPEIAELQGTLRAAEARQAEADAALARTRKLVDLGAGAGKDLIAADTATRAAAAEVAQLRGRLETLSAPPANGTTVSSGLSIRAPARATVLQRLVNPGQWIEPGAILIKLADLSTVWIIANVPEARLATVSVNAPVDIRVDALDGLHITGRVTYIESELDEQTRSAPVRIEVANPGSRLRIGMFVDATIEGRRMGDDELMIPALAVQRIGERTVVFVPEDEPGAFEVRDIELGDEVEDQRVVLTGLTAGEQVVSKGGFTLKSQLLKGQFGEDEELAGEAEP
jgi:cobalt-zinc-cadmium efflux system membrane fusion protein